MAPGRIIDDDEGIRRLLAATQTIAVLGIKTERQAEQPAFYVPRYLVQAGLQVIPVPVYFPDVDRILGQRVYRQLSQVLGPVDLVNIFRRPADLLSHLDDILAKRPRAVWLQLGIRHDELARKLTEAGIDVVQDRCLMVEHRRLG
ncbi:MAG: CoA-binding protein [Panacagrimonas sp.]